MTTFVMASNGCRRRKNVVRSKGPVVLHNLKVLSLCT